MEEKNFNKLAQIIDHTNLKADATEADIRKTSLEAIRYGFRGICINPRWVKLAREIIKERDIKISTVIDWPCGASPYSVRYVQAQKAKEDGADELDLVMDIGNFKAKKYEEVLFDLKEISKILPTKVIIETGFLTEEEIARAAKLVKESGAFCVKTSTGMPPKVDIDTKIKHVKIIKKAVPDIKIKAAGGIRTRADVERLVQAGADIIGTSAGVEIVTE